MRIGLIGTVTKNILWHLVVNKEESYQQNAGVNSNARYLVRCQHAIHFSLSLIIFQ